MSFPVSSEMGKLRIRGIKNSGISSDGKIILKK